MVNVALLVRLEAKPGKESEVESFLKSGLAIVEEEPDTTAWFADPHESINLWDLRRIPDESGRQAHLSGRVAAALMAKPQNFLRSRPLLRRSTYWPQTSVSEDSHSLGVRCPRTALVYRRSHYVTF